MPRRRRLELPNMPLLISHRGMETVSLFSDETDYAHYRDCLLRTTLQCGVLIHGYALLPRRVVLLTNAAAVGATSRAIRNTAQQYAQWLNRRRSRHGALWDGRFKSCLVEPEQVVLSALRYIEQAPQRAGLVGEAPQWPWSSAAAHVCAGEDDVLTPHPAYLRLGIDRRTRGRAWSEYLGVAQDEAQLGQIRAHLAQERALGSAQFQAMVTTALSSPAAWRPRGRPKLCLQ
ncbi:transposase [Tahibacter amnicola]|uniref:Transposase n=1 Tax=Tahibacter amnicola TaxID=2976241 RepID=A0ABY6BAY5_9GAMM|nr:transposase [Tahibacter amnicola]UXI67219.1 transposase [Tahibacter amnicola]